MRTKRRKSVLAGIAAVGVIVGLGGCTQFAGGFDGNGRGGYGNGGGFNAGPKCRDFGGGSYGHRGLEVVGLTADNRLICFREDRPGDARDLAAVSGLAGDASIVGIDYRPANGELIGLGNAGGVYAIDVANGIATKKSQLDVTLEGSTFGIDFNPTVDRLRIVSDTGQNLRANVDTGATLVDGALNSAPGVTATGVAGAAYTNNDTDPNTATTLYDVDSTLDQVAIQAPPNAGTLNPTGKLGVDTDLNAEADIYSTVRDGSTVEIKAFAVLTVGGQPGFYELALFSGKATGRGDFQPGNAVTGIAIPLAQR